MPCIILEVFFKRLQIDLGLKLIFQVGRSSVDANCHRHLVSNTREWLPRGI